MTPTPEQTQKLSSISLKLNGLGIKGATFLRVEKGPVVITYYFNLGQMTPIAKILGKEEDIALSCGVESCLITRKGGEIAIAIPNETRDIVDFDRCLYYIASSPEIVDMKLPIMLGVNTVGEPVALDLVECPHILIAGQTGGGKSVLLASIIAGLVTKQGPEDLKLVLVDTKKLDLPLFSELPHTVNTITTVRQFYDEFDSLMTLVRARTTEMAGLVRNIEEWNSMGMGTKYPYYVVIIDELADIINKEVEYRLKEMLQICRAAGIHIICATQRSSTKIISGDIKANLPTRIALRLPSRFDSMTIISGSGAENLLGKGDMLVESATTNVPVRYHGAFVNMNHIANIISQHDMIRESFKHLRK